MNGQLITTPYSAVYDGASVNPTERGIYLRIHRSGPFFRLYSLFDGTHWMGDAPTIEGLCQILRSTTDAKSAKQDLPWYGLAAPGPRYQMRHVDRRPADPARPMTDVASRIAGLLKDLENDTGRFVIDLG